MSESTDYIILTGATGAIGRELAFALAEQGENLILACRNSEKAESLKKEIEAVTCSSSAIRCVTLDLSSESSVREAVKLFKTFNVKGLINNAGTMQRRYAVDEKGREMTSAVNFYNTVALVDSLTDTLPDNSFITFTTSLTRFLPVRMVEQTEQNFGQLTSYAVSKKMLTSYAARLAQSLASRGIRVNCADPGIVDSGMISMQRWFDPIADIFFRPFIRTPRKGAEVMLRAVFSPLTGKIFTLKNIRPLER